MRNFHLRTIEFVLRESAASSLLFEQDQHQVCLGLVHPDAGHMQRHLDKLVEMVGSDVALDPRTFEMLLHRTMDEVVIRGDHEGSALEEQQ
ncbi:hypothetical protein D3C78_1662340 [compost metagenome]